MNGYVNLVQIDDCKDSTCSTSEWREVSLFPLLAFLSINFTVVLMTSGINFSSLKISDRNNSWKWSDESLVASLAIYDDLLFVGGGFTIYPDNSPSLIENFFVCSPFFFDFDLSF